jgi:hypothetical protein
MRRLAEKDVDFEIEVEPEHIPVEGNASAIDPETDDEIAEEIYAQLDRGNVWAWCTVHVIASWKNFQGDDYLGGCSYKSEAEFKRDAYYADMKKVALDDLNEKVAAAYEGMRGLK